jgi:large subunit ribosomal protein L6
MSRIGKKPIQIPENVTLKLDGQHISVKGPKGELEYTVHNLVKVALTDKEVILSIANPEDKTQKALWGTNRQLVANLIQGVTEAYSKQLEIKGVGYRAEIKGDLLILNVGYSHPVEFKIPGGVTASLEKNIITLESIDKQLVGETAASIRKVRKPEPYKGKGIKYVDEVILRKAGKQVKTGTA